MTPREKTIATWYRIMQSRRFWVFQWPDERWDCAELNSTVGKNLKQSGRIYPDCQPKHFELVNL